ncbi:hypothetical protein [Halorhodospira halochloris]|uniref:hypothetical protein n=1 Tax=Halorhodospira halochloris TaxID=1052 RepID=UPI001EE7DC63|nr:hypothetical protein [Halorhodospira halochloris]
MEELAEVRLHKKTLDILGLPDRPFPLPIDALELIIAEHEEFFAHLLLHGLQLEARSGTADWLANEPLIDKLLDYITPPDDRVTLTGEGEEWFVEYGPVDLKHAEQVTIQRGLQVIASITDSGKGPLCLAAYRPLDAKSCHHHLILSSYHQTNLSAPLTGIPSLRSSCSPIQRNRRRYPSDQEDGLYEDTAYARSRPIYQGYRRADRMFGAHDQAHYSARRPGQGQAAPSEG